MKTYKIPTLGLEILAEDATDGKEFGLMSKGWRIPTLEEISLIWDLGKLGVLSVSKGSEDAYLYKEGKWGAFYPQTGDTPMYTKRRLVKNI